MTKVSFFIPNFNGGGAENSACELANEFVKNTINTEIIVLKDIGPTKKILSKKVNIKSLNAKKMIFSLLKFTNYIKKTNPDFIITNLNHSSFIALFAKRIFKLKYKIIITFVNKINLNLNPKNLINLIYILFIKMLIDQNTNIVTITEGIKNDLIKYWKFKPKMITVIYPPSNIDNINTLKNIKNKDKLIIDKKNKYILSVGRLSKQKDHYTLIKAFDLLEKKINSELIIIGEGKEYNKLNKLVKKLNLSKKVHFRKYTLNPYYYMKNCDLFVLSSKWEGFAIVLVSALVCKIPIISTNCRHGPSEILENGKWGRLTDVGNVEDLYKNMLDILSNNKTFANSEKRAENFSLTKSVRSHLKLIGI